MLKLQSGLDIFPLLFEFATKQAKRKFPSWYFWGLGCLSSRTALELSNYISSRTFLAAENISALQDANCRMRKSSFRISIHSQERIFNVSWRCPTQSQRTRYKVKG